MRIAYIYTSLTTIGGADRVITEKANYFAEYYGCEVYIITDSQNGHSLSFPISPKVMHINLDINFNRQYHKPFLQRGYIYLTLMRKYKQKLNEVLCRIRPDFTITTMGKDIDFLTLLTDGSYKIAEAHVAKNYVRNLHLMKQRSLPYKIVANIWTKRIEKAVAKFDAFVVLTENDAASWKQVREATIIPNSVPFLPDGSSLCDGKTIISVGRLNEQKGYDLLIDTWKVVSQKHPDWKLCIYGNGELKNELTAQIHKQGVEDSFFLMGPVENIADKYIESAFYVMSSRFEGFGMVLIEAMACGLPCISFNCPHGPSDIIKHQEDGLLVENGNVNELAKSICYLIEQEEVRKEMGKRAKENVKRYNASLVMHQWFSLFESIYNRTTEPR